MDSGSPHNTEKIGSSASDVDQGPLRHCPEERLHRATKVETWSQNDMVSKRRARCRLRATRETMPVSHVSSDDAQVGT